MATSLSQQLVKVSGTGGVVKQNLRIHGQFIVQTHNINNLSYLQVHTDKYSAVQ